MTTQRSTDSSKSNNNTQNNNSNQERRFSIIDEVRAPATKISKISAFIWKISSVASSSITTTCHRFTSAFLLKGKQRGLTVLATITFLYLLTEFAFSAWLLDVMASDSSKDTISQVEHYGRLISGFAVALLVWPWVLRATRYLITSIIALTIVTTPIMAAVYFGERALIDSLVKSSTADERAAAMTGSLLRQGLASGSIQGQMLNGLWQAENAQSTAGKAFAGVVAYMAASSTEAQNQTMAIAPTLIREVIDHRSGGAEAELERFIASQNDIKSQYSSYLKGQNDYREAMKVVGDRANNAWEEYLDALGKRHKFWGRYMIKYTRDGHLAPKRARPEIRRAVRAKGIPVSDDWNTGDKATFVRLAKGVYTKEIQKSYGLQMQGLRSGLSLMQFAADPIVQKRWHEAMGYPDTIGKLSLSSLSQKEFTSKIYESVLASRTNRQLTNYQAKAHAYGEGQTLEKDGTLAYESMIAPVLALTLSLIGALVHIAKSGLLAVQLSTGWHFKSGLIKSMVISIGVILTLYIASISISTELTSHPTYQQWNQIRNEIDFKSIESIKAHLLSVSLDAMIKMQSIAYPVFNIVRNHSEPIFTAIHASGIESTLYNLIEGK